MLKNYLKYILIHLLSFIINYLIFITLISITKNSDAIMIQIINLIAWIVSMLFIFYIDKKYVPELINENNSTELFKFILIRILSFIIEAIILFIFMLLSLEVLNYINLNLNHFHYLLLLMLQYYLPLHLQ